MKCALPQPWNWPAVRRIKALARITIIPNMDDWEVFPRQARAVGPEEQLSRGLPGSSGAEKSFPRGGRRCH